MGVEYSRFDANVENLYEISVYRSSDHDPVILGLDLPASEPAIAANMIPSQKPGCLDTGL